MIYLNSKWHHLDAFQQKEKKKAWYMGYMGQVGWVWHRVGSTNVDKLVSTMSQTDECLTMHSDQGSDWKAILRWSSTQSCTSYMGPALKEHALLICSVEAAAKAMWNIKPIWEGFQQTTLMYPISISLQSKTQHPNSKLLVLSTRRGLHLQ